MGITDPKATTVGPTTGFPLVLAQQGVEGNELGSRSFAVPTKKAVKVTQMPIFIEESKLSHRQMVRAKETPRQKFKNLPGSVHDTLAK